MFSKQMYNAWNSFELEQTNHSRQMVIPTKSEKSDICDRTQPLYAATGGAGPVDDAPPMVGGKKRGM